MSDDFEGFDPFEGLTDLTGGEQLPPLEPDGVPQAVPPRSPMLTGLIVGLLLVVLTVALFQLLRDDGDGTAAPGATTTTEPTGGTGSTSGVETTTTGPSDTTTTLPSSQPFTPYEAQGEPVTLDNLTLAVDSIGPIELGRPAKAAIGRLVASLGEPDEDTGPIVSTGAYGTCEGSTVRIVRWGALAAVVVVDGGDEVFAGYRVDLAYEDAFTSVTAELQTLSGLRLGNSIRRIEEIYADFDRRFVVDPDVGDAFEIYGSNSGALLLWGPITTPDSGTVRGIFSPDACDRFQ